MKRELVNPDRKHSLTRRIPQGGPLLQKYMCASELVMVKLNTLVKEKKAISWSLKMSQNIWKMCEMKKYSMQSSELWCNEAYEVLIQWQYEKFAFLIYL